ncbi:hypothetical protein ACFV1L_24395 [Kitasatospora sp. NPDC059646]|uniref:hypothetical protein n=1 Tax=Kitasatospora sp. NPDC059646 TaxID=3346893 RepID=UPI0036AA0D1C
MRQLQSLLLRVPDFALTTTAIAAPGPDDDQASDRHEDRAAKASPDRDKGSGKASAGTSVPPAAGEAVPAGQQSRTRGPRRGDNPLPAAAEVRWKPDSTEPVRRGVLVPLGLFRRATARELWHLVLPGQRNDKATRDALVDLEAAERVREELRLPDNWKLWTLTAAGRREAAQLLLAGTRLSKLRTERDGGATAYSEHTLDVVALPASSPAPGSGT